MELFKIQKKYQKDMRIRSDIQIDGYKGFVLTTKLGNPFTHEGMAAALKRIVKRANNGTCFSAYIYNSFCIK